jgi:hypothetical protein
MKTLLRLIALSLLTAGLSLGLARANSLNYSVSGTSASKDVTGIYMPANCTIVTTSTIDTTSNVYSGSAVAVITYNHAPYATVHALSLTAAHVSQSWTDSQVADTYALHEICSVAAPAVATVSVTFNW